VKPEGEIGGESEIGREILKGRDAERKIGS
jgi:hypothetical protein